MIPAAFGLALVYFAVLLAFSLLAHSGLQTQMNDLGNADQAFWRAANGDWRMVQSNDVFGQLRSRFGMHINLLYLPLACLYRLSSDPRLLLVLNTLACAAAGLGLFFVGRERLGSSWWSMAPIGAFFLSPMVHDANLFGFHIITVATALMVWIVWAFETGRRGLAFVLLVAALACKEDIPVVAMMLGLTYVLSRKWRRGTVIIVFSIVYLILATQILVPFAEISENPMGVASRYSSVFSDPLEVLTSMARPDRLRLPVYFLLSGLVMAWRGWRWLPLVLPSLGMALLSNTLWMTRISGTYYWILAEAVIVLACIEAARRGRESGAIRAGPLKWLVAATIFFSLVLSPLPFGLHAGFDNFKVPEPGIEALRELMVDVPEGDTLSVQNNLGPHLSQRRDIATFPRRIDQADWVVFDLHYRGGPCSGLFVRTTPRIMLGMEIDRLEAAIRELVAAPDWDLVSEGQGLYLFSRDWTDGPSVEQILPLVERDLAVLRGDYRVALEDLSPLAGLTVGRLSWADLLAGEFLRPGNLPGDPVTFIRRFPLKSGS
jgi:uncharacterized membrane protein